MKLTFPTVTALLLVASTVNAESQLRGQQFRNLGPQNKSSKSKSEKCDICHCPPGHKGYKCLDLKVDCDGLNGHGKHKLDHHRKCTAEELSDGPDANVTQEKTNKTEEIEAKSSKATGTEAKSSKATGTEAKSSKATGTKAKSSKATGTKAKSSKATGTKAKSSKATGTKAKSSKATGTEAKSSKATGTKAKSTKATGTKAKSSKATGTEAKSSKASGTEEKSSTATETEEKNSKAKDVEEENCTVCQVQRGKSKSVKCSKLASYEANGDYAGECDPDTEEKKCQICHKNGENLSVGCSAVPDHIKHGDFRGACKDPELGKMNAEQASKEKKEVDEKKKQKSTEVEEMEKKVKDVMEKLEEAKKKAEETGDPADLKEAEELEKEAEAAEEELEVLEIELEGLDLRSFELGNLMSANLVGLGNGAGGGFGDPHLKTWRGHRYDYHGECDLVLVHSDTFGNGQGLDLHIRTEIRRDWSYISDAALRIGKDILEVDSKGHYYLNGVKDAEMPSTIGGFEMTHKISKSGRLSLDVNLQKKGHIRFREYKEFVSVNIVQGREDLFGDSIGLMGSFGTGQMLLRDNETVEEDPITFAQEWQVRQHEPKLFRHMRAPQYPQTCNLPSAKRESRRRLEEDGITVEMAEKACENWGEDKEGCIYDVMATGELDLAQAGAF